MKKLILATLLVFAGCSSKIDDSKNILSIGNDLHLSLKDQFDKPIEITKDTKKVIFVFAKDTGHMVKNYLNTKDTNFLKTHHIVFVADVAPMPSIIKNMFAIPDLKKHKYPIMLIEDENIEAKFKTEKNKDKIVIVFLDNFKITDIKMFKDIEEAKKYIN